MKRLRYSLLKHEGVKAKLDLDLTLFKITPDSDNPIFQQFAIRTEFHELLLIHNLKKMARNSHTRITIKIC